MRTKLAALLAAALLANAAPAAACGFFGCPVAGDDSYPPGVAPLPPAVQMEVIARQGKGLSLAGFYNDPSLALAYGYARSPEPVLRRSY